MDSALKIGQLASRCEVSVDTIRFYERERLLPRPMRTPSGYRMYGPEDERRVRFIRHAQAIGFSLENVRELMREQRLHTQDECAHVARLLQERIVHLDRRIDELRQFRHQLADNLTRCEQGAKSRCPVIVDLSSPQAAAGEDA